MKAKKIAIFTSCEGHLSLAQAVGGSLATDYEVVYFQEVDDVFALYVLLYQFFPAGHVIPYTISKYKAAMSLLQRSFQKRYRDKLYRFIDEHQPDVLVNTYFMYNPTLEEVAAERNLPFFNVITDPKSVHPLTVAHAATANLAFNQETSDLLSPSLAESAHIKAIGWFTRSHFEEPYELLTIRRELKLKPKMLTFLVAAGSEGTTHILKILPTLFQTARPLQIVVACGNNKLLYRSVSALKTFLTRTGSPHRLLPLRFTIQLHKYMQASDLIIGKAGPNSVFEAIATRTPFFAITHISGQEDGNLEIIRDFNLGITEENPLKATKLLQEIIDDPSVLERFAKPIAKMAEYNQQSKVKLKKMIDQSLR